MPGRLMRTADGNEECICGIAVTSGLSLEINFGDCDEQGGLALVVSGRKESDTTEDWAGWHVIVSTSPASVPVCVHVYADVLKIKQVKEKMD